MATDALSVLRRAGLSLSILGPINIAAFRLHDTYAANVNTCCGVLTGLVGPLVVWPSRPHFPAVKALLIAVLDVVGGCSVGNVGGSCPAVIVRSGSLTHHAAM